MDSTANYLENFWLKKSAIWGRGLVLLIKNVRKRHIYENGMHSEGRFKHLKHQPDKSTNGVEPAVYFHSRYKGIKESYCLFVAD